MTTPQSQALRLAERITDYLSTGGLFNPELANHDAVSELLIACRDALAQPSAESAQPLHCKWPGCPHGAECVHAKSAQAVAFQYWTTGESWRETSKRGYEAHRDAGDNVRALYTHPAPASAQGDEARKTEIEKAAIDLMNYVHGELPRTGYLRDNDASRAAISRLRTALSIGMTAKGESK